MAKQYISWFDFHNIILFLGNLWICFITSDMFHLQRCYSECKFIMAYLLVDFILSIFIPLFSCKNKYFYNHLLSILKHSVSPLLFIALVFIICGSKCKCVSWETRTFDWKCLVINMVNVNLNEMDEKKSQLVLPCPFDLPVVINHVSQHLAISQK